MNLESMVQVGGKIEVILGGKHSKDIKGFSMIQDILGDGQLIITLPMIEGRHILLETGNKVEIFFFEKETSFSFVGKVTDRYRMKNVVVVNVEQVSPIKKIQRRDFYRLKITLPITFKVVEPDQGIESPTLKGYSIDISGGGLGLNTDYNLGIDTIIECYIALHNARTLCVNGKVIRSEVSSGLGCKYDLGISFYDIPRKIREELVKFIFQKQRELRKKGFI